MTDTGKIVKYQFWVRSYSELHRGHTEIHREIKEIFWVTLSVYCIHSSRRASARELSSDSTSYWKPARSATRLKYLEVARLGE